MAVGNALVTLGWKKPKDIKVGWYVKRLGAWCEVTGIQWLAIGVVHFDIRNPSRKAEDFTVFPDAELECCEEVMH